MPRSRRLSDATLVRRSQQGDRRAFAALLTRYDWRLRGLAHALLLDPAEMDAALGVGYLRAWRDVVRISPSDDVAAWLYRVAYNACIDQLRRADGAAARAVSPAPPAPGVATGLAALAAADRVVVVLVDREGFSPSSAARIMGLSADAVTATLDRARATLVDHVPPAQPEAPDPGSVAAESAPELDLAPVDVDAEAAGAAAGSDDLAQTRVVGADEVDSGGSDDRAQTSLIGVDEADRGGTDGLAEAGAVGSGGVAEAGAVGSGGVAEAGAVGSGDVAEADVDEAEAEADAVGAVGAGVTDPDGADDHGPLDHEAVADAVVAEAAATETPTLTSPVLDDAHEPDGVSGNGSGNGNAARSLNGHVSNSGRGRRARRRAKHAAAQRPADGSGPAGDDSA